MIQAYNKSKIKEIMYSLKQEWGSNAIWYIFEETEADLRHGTVNVDYTITNIRRAILMPSIIDRTFHYSLTFLAAGNNFVYGGYRDRDTRNLIVDIRDIPKVYRNREPNNGDRMLLDGKRYEVSKFDWFEHGMAALFVLKRVVGAKANIHHKVSITSGVSANGQASATVA